MTALVLSLALLLLYRAALSFRAARVFLDGIAHPDQPRRAA